MHRKKISQNHLRYSYHRQYVNQTTLSTTLNSTMIEDHHLNPLSYNLNGGPSTGNLSQIDRLPTGVGGGYYGSKPQRYYVPSEYSENTRCHYNFLILYFVVLNFIFKNLYFLSHFSFCLPISNAFYSEYLKYED